MNNKTFALEDAARRVTVFSVACVYALAVLSTADDKALVFNLDVTVIPFVNARLNSWTFLALAPIFILVVYQYFQASLVGMLESQSTNPTEDAAPRPSIALDLVTNLTRADSHLLAIPARILSVCVVWCLAPLSIFICWYRALITHSIAISCVSLAALILMVFTTSHTFWLARLTSTRMRTSLTIALSALALCLALVTVTFSRNIPAPCTESRDHDANHPFFDRDTPGLEEACLERAGTGLLLQVARLWALPGLAQGPDLRTETIYSKDTKPPAKPPVLSGLNLSNVDALGFTAQAAHLPGARMNGSLFRSSDFSDAYLRYINVFMTDFRESTLTNSSFIRSRMDFVDFSDSNLDNAWFRGATIKRGSFQRATLRGAHFSCATFVNTDLSHIKISAATEFDHTRILGESLIDLQGPRSGICMDSAALSRNASHYIPCPAEDEWLKYCRQNVGN